MKKRIFAMLLSALLVANISACNTYKNISNITNEKIIGSLTNNESSPTESENEMTEKNNMPSNTGSTIDFKVLAKPVYLVPYWKETDDGQRYVHFLEQMEQNVYDQWLYAELLKGDRLEEDIYTEYLELWKNEIAFTIQGGEVLCGSYSTITITSHQYAVWKEYTEQWLTSADTLLQVELELLEQEEIQSLGALISHCMLVRQQAIGIKDFLYHLEFECQGLKASDLQSVAIDWAPMASELMSKLEQDNNILEGANQFSSYSEISTLFYDFRNQVIHSFEDRKLLENSFSNLDTEDPDISHNITGIYFDNLWYWEKNEFPATVSHGENILEAPTGYNLWRDSFEQLLSNTKALMRCQSSIFIRYCPEAYILKCSTIREHILNSKFFLYYLEYQQKAAEGVENIEVEIKWSTKG